MMAACSVHVCGSGVGGGAWRGLTRGGGDEAKGALVTTLRWTKGDSASNVRPNLVPCFNFGTFFA